MGRGNLFMLVLVAGLGTFYYVHDIKGKPAREEAERKAKRFFAELSKKDIQAVKVERLKPAPGATPFVRDMGLERGIWVLKEAQPKALRTASIGSAVKSLVELEQAESMTTAGSKPVPAEFGLDKPSFKLTLKDRKGKEHSLLVGDKTPDEQGYYVTPGPGRDISVINSTLPELLEADVETNHETSPLAFETSSANKVILQAGAQPPIEVALDKPRSEEEDSESDDGIEMTDLNEVWKLRRPQAAEADGNKVRDLLYAWKNVKLGRFLKSEEKVDFSQPTVKLSVFVDRQSEPFVLEVGQAVVNKPGLYYARRTWPEEKMVLEIKDLKLLEPSLASVLQQHLFVIQPEDVAKLEATIEGVAIKASKSGEQWKVSQPKLDKADEEARGLAVNDLVWEIKNLEWKSEPPAASIPKDWKDRAVVELFDKKGKSLAKVQLGAVGPQGAGALVRGANGKVYATEKDPFSRWQELKLKLEGKAPKAPAAASPTPAPFVMPSQ